MEVPLALHSDYEDSSWGEVDEAAAEGLPGLIQERCHPPPRPAKWVERVGGIRRAQVRERRGEGAP